MLYVNMSSALAVHLLSISTHAALMLPTCRASPHFAGFHVDGCPEQEPAARVARILCKGPRLPICDGGARVGGDARPLHPACSLDGPLACRWSTTHGSTRRRQTTSTIWSAQQPAKQPARLRQPLRREPDAAEHQGRQQQEQRQPRPRACLVGQGGSPLAEHAGLRHAPTFEDVFGGGGSW